MKRNRRPQPQPGTFTTSQIRDAYAAAKIWDEANAHGERPESTVRTLFDGWDETGDFVRAKLDQLARGTAILDRAMLVVSAAVLPDSPAGRTARAGLAPNGSEIISVYAGDDGSVRYVTLAPRAHQFAQVGEVRTAYAVPA